MRAVLLSIVVLSIAACSPPASDTTTESSGETQSASTAAPPSGGLRQGRWSQVTTVMGQQTTDVHCVTSEDLNQMGSPPNSNCTSPQGYQRTAEGYVYEATCADGGSLRTVMTGDLQNNYVVDMTMSVPGAGQAMQVHIEGTYEGACHGDE
jgi:hypothetical protein